MLYGAKVVRNCETHHLTMNIEIPAGLTDLLQEFTISVLRDKPNDLVQFASDYFNKLNQNRSPCRSSSKKGVTFGGSAPDDEPMQTDSSDEEPFGKSTTNYTIYKFHKLLHRVRRCMFH